MARIGKRPGRLAVVLAAGMWIAACGGDAGPSGDGGGNSATAGQEEPDEQGGGGGTALDGCSLVTAADAEAIFGEPAIKGEISGSVPTNLLAAWCIWEVEDETSFKLLQFYVWDGEQFFSEEAYEGEEGFEPVDVGERGFVVGSLGLTLQFMRNGKTVSLDVTAFNVEDDRDAEAVKALLLDLGRKVDAALA